MTGQHGVICCRIYCIINFNLHPRHVQGFFLIKMFRKALSNKYVKGGLKAIGIFSICLLVLLEIAAAYVHFNKDEIIASIEEKINNSISGNLTVKSTDISILTNFPNISVNLYEVSLTDSLYKKPLLQSGEIAIRINIFQLLSANPDVAKLVVKNLL